MTKAALYMLCLLNSIIVDRKENVLFERLTPQVRRFFIAI